MRINMKFVLAGFVGSALLAQAGHAQPAPLEGMSPREKARYDEKMRSRQETDRSYKSTLDRIPDSKQKPDPWGSLRTPDPGAAGKN
jgi:hypothetical protein